jgi:hypothetical protein
LVTLVSFVRFIFHCLYHATFIFNHQVLLFKEKMGSVLSSPVTTKNRDSDGSAYMYYVTSAMQGWRTSMEDAHTCLLSLENTADNRIDVTTNTVSLSDSDAAAVNKLPDISDLDSESATLDTSKTQIQTENSKTLTSGTTDKTATANTISKTPSETASKHKYMGFFAVFDGHGGTKTNHTHYPNSAHLYTHIILF